MCNVSKVFNVAIITGLLMAAISGCSTTNQPNNPVDSQQPDITGETADQAFSLLDSDWSGLDTSQIETVSLYPYRTTDEPVVLSEEDVTELVNLLNKVELSGEGEPIAMFPSGIHTGMFHIELTDGSGFDFAAISPLSYYINLELRFWAKREISYAIQEFYLDLNKKYYGILQQQDSDDQGFSLFDIDLSQLDVSQIESVSLYPYRVMDEPVTLSVEDVTELVNLLNEVELLGEGHPLMMLASGDRSGMFHIELTDGTIFEFAASPPDAYYINLELQFYTEDEVSYDISQFYFAMLRKYYDL